MFPSNSFVTLKRLRNRCVKSQQLINLYDNISSNIQSSIQHAGEQKKLRSEAIERLRSSMVKYQESMTQSSSGSQARRKTLETELQTQTEGFRANIKKEEDERIEIDNQITV